MPFKRWQRWLLILLLPLTLIWLADQLFPLPLPEDDLARVVLAEDGTPLWRFADRDGVWRYPVTPDEVSPYYLEALLTYEDRWFRQHPGINPLALGRAAWQNLTGGRVVSGGSTLSMQVARLLDPHGRDLPGKLKQLWRTAQLEWHLSKDEILTLYLNRAPFGGTLEGVAAASWSYLGKPPSQLTRADAALLAVLPQAPSRLRPDRHPERAQAARDKVLRRLGEFQVWPQAQVDEALEEPVFLAPRREPSLAPLLARRLNRAGSPPLIRTTLDAGLQLRLEDLLLGWRARLPERTSAAILVVEHESMAVRAYLGSVDIADTSRFGHVDMVRALRSPGSTLKPFLYGMALDAGLIHSESLLQDVPRHYGDYRPGNFAAGFIGPVSASEALATSLNLPAVQLLEAYGPKRFAGELRSAGVPIRLPALAEPNLALILGGGGSRLESLVAGYSAFARGGMAAKPRLQPGDELRERRLLSPGSAWIIRRILSGQARPDRDPRAYLAQRPTLAWKTGTSYGFRDAWAIGVGPRHLIGIWIGRPDGTPVPGQFGLASAAPLLLQVHDLLVNRDSQRGIAAPADPQPAEVGVAAICWPLGQPMSKDDPNCRRLRFAWTLEGTTPPTLLAADQPLGSGLRERYWLNAEGRRVGPGCAGAEARELALWPAPLEPWLPRREQRTARLPSVDPSCPPPRSSQVAPLSIVGVRDGDRLRRPQGNHEPLRLSLSALGGSGRRWWFLDGRPLGDTALDAPFNHAFDSGRHQLSVLDEGGQTARLEFSVGP
ncbi:peptidoglycan glycosyltransferase PbpC [Pseudomonas chengduensis]|jgi:penicillin-binding protein 1C|uniref:peptidoglycan glycosyltransferase n=1 Tax=Ectopseudomonas chengduensis TaxID=489632 RepID=A0A1G6S9M7_9GAMM|nr:MULTISPECIES: peptidoglycan glycosyltransferase PbpC [Pseudomonas]KQO44164.1 penicillin-binding protein 1C [Pseudomonas sp. Leaf83]MBP3063418.1 peptidoglycan glycosyltransferase PbpC [Pseudomonas chengduensis]MDH1536054.1 peptidoglycan glycosyltransferase PbpC [Pseudomonas chengduensis]NNB76308.1 peptidoglycan glycosyltransferase PbpC [Pseudomonas chengduensis]SDD12817.1 penicillin-binding protein 1C [Pseudomonas chengduensis]